MSKVAKSKWLRGRSPSRPRALRRVCACALTKEVVARQLDRRGTELVILTTHAAGKRTLCEHINRQAQRRRRQE